MIKLKVMEVPSYPELACVGKTCEHAVTGTIDRKTISRRLLTTEVFDKDYMVVGGDDTKFVHVDELGKDAETELFVELVGGVRSVASFKFFGGYKAANPENPDVTELYVDKGSPDETGKIDRLVACAHRMCDAHAECDSQWKIVDKDGKRYFIRYFDGSVDKSGYRA